jgi:hypothetical protein
MLLNARKVFYGAGSHANIIPFQLLRYRSP